MAHIDDVTRRDDDGESWTYRDPEGVYARRQGKDLKRAERTCAGCIHILPSPIKGDTAIACDKRMRRPSRSVEESRRCEIHEEKT